MRKCHSGLRHHFLDLHSRPFNIIYPVVHIIDLAFAGKFADNCLPDHFFIVFHDIGLDRHTVSGRLLQNTHIPDPHHAHMKRARDRCRGQRQHVHIFFHLLDLFFMCDAEALLLVHDQKPQIFELYIF